MPNNSVVFFGSGPVATESLRQIAGFFPIEAIVTKRSTANEMKQNFSHTPTYTVDNKQELDDLIASKPFNSQLGILIDFGIIVSQEVIGSFRFGIVNSHFSLLPQWRGADPISFAILNGQPQTGVSLMLIVERMDEGPLLLQSPLPIPADATTASLTQGLVRLSSEMLRKAIPKYLAGELKPYPQNTQSTPPSYSRKLTKMDGLIDWGKPAEQLEREIRAFTPWPRSYTILGGKHITITKASLVNENGAPGTISTVNKQFIVHCGQRSLSIERLIPAGKQAMDAQAFLAGYRHQLEADRAK